MNKLHPIKFKFLLAVFGLLVWSTEAQTQKKTYTETFAVEDETVLNINTSHADLEFDTWNKKQVLVEAVIELEGATEEEAAAYFKNNGIKILGNSTEIEISTPNTAPWYSAHISGIPGHPDDILIEIPEAPFVEPFFMDLEIPDLPPIPELATLPPMPPIPPVPPMSFGEFDYEEYQKRGEAYLKEWSKEFQQNFDEEWAESMKEWGEQYKENMKEYEKTREEYREEREAMREEQRQMREEMRQEVEEHRQKAMEEREKAREEVRKAREEQRQIQRNVIIAGEKSDAPRIYYPSSGGKTGKYRVKRTIRIKMPKSVKLKMNVRHGEVKLAENMSNIHATLSYARLLASTIDGDQTHILASYTPVSVQNWNLGTLNTRYSGDIDLKDVNYLVLDATSSEVSIERLLKSATVKNDLGKVYIRSVSPDFDEMDIYVQNGQLQCALPETPYQILAQGSQSSFSYPQQLKLKKTADQSKTVLKGFYLDENANKRIVINSRFSEIKLQE